jgi:hypothetical protein
MGTLEFKKYFDDQLIVYEDTIITLYKDNDRLIAYGWWPNYFSIYRNGIVVF